MNILQKVIRNLLLLKQRKNKMKESENQKMDDRISGCHSGHHRTPYPQQPNGIPAIAGMASPKWPQQHCTITRRLLWPQPICHRQRSLNCRSRFSKNEKKMAVKKSQNFFEIFAYLPPISSHISSLMPSPSFPALWLPSSDISSFSVFFFPGIYGYYLYLSIYLLYYDILDRDSTQKQQGRNCRLAFFRG